MSWDRHINDCVAAYVAELPPGRSPSVAGATDFVMASNRTYARKKLQPLRVQVALALKAAQNRKQDDVLKKAEAAHRKKRRVLEGSQSGSGDEGDDGSSSDSLEFDPNVKMMTVEDTNHSNNMMRSLYNKGSGSAPPATTTATTTSTTTANGSAKPAYTAVSVPPKRGSATTTRSGGSALGTQGTSAPPPTTSATANTAASPIPATPAPSTVAPNVGEGEGASTGRRSRSRTPKTKAKTRSRKRRRRRNSDSDSGAESDERDAKKGKFEGERGLTGAGQYLTEPKARLAELGGMEDRILEVLRMLAVPLLQPIVYTQLHAKPPRGILLYGPSGCGKTHLANAIAGELYALSNGAVSFMSVNAPELVAGVSGESEAQIRELFDTAASMQPCLLFIDEIDAIAPKRASAAREMERRIVAQLLTSLGSLDGAAVMVLAATNRPNSLDDGLRRAGRFDREISLGVPNEEARRSILATVTRDLVLDEHVSLDSLAARTPGYVGSDLVALVSEAAQHAIDSLFESKSAADKGRVASGSGGGGGGGGDVQMSDAGTTANTATATTPVLGNSVVGSVGSDTSSGGSVVGGSVAGDGMTVTTVTAVATTTISTESVAAVGGGGGTSVSGGGDVEMTEASESGEQAETSPPATITTTTTTTTTAVSAPITSTAGSSLVLDYLNGVATPLDASDLAGLKVRGIDFEAALELVQPSAKREGFATVPDVTWDDVGALDHVRKILQDTVVSACTEASKWKHFNIDRPPGILLFGPPGCGKTLLAKAIANDSRSSFISVKGPELLNKYVGEAERAVRGVFARAKASEPCVIFFDEFDALCPTRDNSSSHGGDRVVNQLLTEMDGVQSLGRVYVIAATNRPDMIDNAMLRSGRLGTSLYVTLPTVQERVSVLRAVARKTPLAPGVDLAELAMSPDLNGFSGADLAAYVREASMLAMHDPDNVDMVVDHKHFKQAVKMVVKSVTDETRRHYDNIARKLGVLNAPPPEPKPVRRKGTKKAAGRRGSGSATATGDQGNKGGDVGSSARESGESVEGGESVDVSV